MDYSARLNTLYSKCVDRDSNNKWMGAEKTEEMTEVEVQGKLEDFIQTGRTGRRNAVGNILSDPHSEVSTAGLSIDLDKLKCSDDSDKKTNSSNETSEGAVGGADIKGS